MLCLGKYGIFYVEVRLVRVELNQTVTVVQLIQKSGL